MFQPQIVRMKIVQFITCSLEKQTFSWTANLNYFCNLHFQDLCKLKVLFLLIYLILEKNFVVMQSVCDNDIVALRKV